MSVIVISACEKENEVIGVAKDVKSAMTFLFSSGWFNKGTANWGKEDWEEFYSWYPTFKDFQNAPFDEIRAVLDNNFNFEYFEVL